MTFRLGFLGGTGIEGKGLALRFAAAGASVCVGSRSEERAQATAQEYNAILGKSAIRGTGNLEMLASCEIVFLTVPFDRAVTAIESCRQNLYPGLVLVDVTVPMQFTKGEPEYLDQDSRSNAELIAALLPEEVHLVGAFKTVPAHVLAELDTLLDCDVFVCSDSEKAREKVIEAARLIPRLRPLDAGPLRTARTLERMTVLAVWLNRRYKKKGARYRIVGL